VVLLSGTIIQRLYNMSRGAQIDVIALYACSYVISVKITFGKRAIFCVFFGELPPREEDEPGTAAGGRDPLIIL